jgi:hypothetical protein
MKLITIRESHQAFDLAILQSMLESAGIECFLKNEFTTQILNHIQSTMVELQVAEDDVEKALKIMQKYDDES